MLMSFNKDKTAMHDCHFLGAIVARMRKVLAIPRKTRSWYLCFRAYFGIITLSHYDQTTNFRMSSEWESEEETDAVVYTLGTRGLFLACGLVYNNQPFCVSLFRPSWFKNSLQSSSSFRRYWRSQTQAARIRKRGSDWVMSGEMAFLHCLPPKRILWIKRILAGWPGWLLLYSW